MGSIRGRGYDISNVARAWTLAWAVMNEIELKEELPESFLKEVVKMGMEERELRGPLRTPLHSQNKENRVEMERVIHYIKETVLPKVKG